MFFLRSSKLLATLACSALLVSCGVPQIDGAGSGVDEGASISNAPETREATETEEPYIDVDPEPFIEGSGATVAGTPESGVSGCYLIDKNPDDPRQSELVVCQARFRYPTPDIEFDGGWPNPPYANAITFNFETAEFETGMSPGSQGFVTPPRALEPGQRVTIYGTTIYHLRDGGFRAERQDTGFEVHNGVIQHDWDSTDRLAQSQEPVGKGTVCGRIYSLDDKDRLVVAAEDGTVCPTAMDAMDGYVTALRKGDSSIQGNAALWESPENWGCSGRYFFDGEENIGANGKLSCSAGGLNGNAAGTSSGAVVALEPDDVSRL